MKAEKCCRGCVIQARRLVLIRGTTISSPRN